MGAMQANAVQAGRRSILPRSRATSSAGARSSVSSRSASPTATSPTPKPRLAAWLARGWHGDMDYMAAHGAQTLAPGRARARHAARHLRAHELSAGRGAAGRARARRSRSAPIVSRYALGRDYHKVMRRRLQRLADRIEAAVGPFRYRAFTDSAPVMEVELARESGPRLARQAHAAAQPRGRLVFLPRRDLHRPAAAGRCAGGRPLRHLPQMHRRRARPARSSRPTSSTRGAAFPTSRSSTRARFPRRCGRSSAIASTAATTASSCARGTVSRKRAPKPDFAVRNGLDARDARRSVRAGAKRSSTSGSPAAPSTASATSAGCATSRWAWAMRSRGV